MVSFRFLLIASLSILPVFGGIGPSAGTVYALETADRCAELREEIAALKRQIRQLERQIDDLEELRDRLHAQCQREVDKLHDCIKRWSGNGVPNCGSLPSCNRYAEVDRQLQEAREQLQDLKDQLSDLEDEADDLDCPGNVDLEDIIIRAILN